MTEITKCIAPDCGQLAAAGEALCLMHRERLQKIEDEILADASRKIRADMRQFERLLYVEPPLHSSDIAFRMPMPIKKVRQWLRKFRDDRA